MKIGSGISTDKSNRQKDSKGLGTTWSETRRKSDNTIMKEVGAQKKIIA